MFCSGDKPDRDGKASEERLLFTYVESYAMVIVCFFSTVPQLVAFISQSQEFPAATFKLECRLFHLFAFCVDVVCGLSKYQWMLNLGVWVVSFWLAGCLAGCLAGSIIKLFALPSRQRVKEMRSPYSTWRRPNLYAIGNIAFNHAWVYTSRAYCPRRITAESNYHVLLVRVEL